MPELEQLYHLLAVAEYGTLSAAAEALHISQPSLTRSMQKLESEFGTPLFERTKNKASLNEAGRLAVAEAGRVTAAAGEMRSRMQAYVRSLHTISVGSCAPAPMWALTPALSRIFPDRTIAAEMKAPEALLAGLRAGMYQIIVLDHLVEETGILCREYTKEQLYISLPSAHPLAKKAGLYLSELAGQTMLIYSDLGVWQRLHDEKMRDIHFIVQTERRAFADLISASVLPNFTTNLTHMLMPPALDRVNVPILDTEATITFYLCVPEKQKKLLDVIS
jgi:DNA-binding transcriptional LysR family regulator